MDKLVTSLLILSACGSAMYLLLLLPGKLLDRLFDSRWQVRARVVSALLFVLPLGLPFGAIVARFTSATPVAPAGEAAVLAAFRVGRDVAAPASNGLVWGYLATALPLLWISGAVLLAGLALWRLWRFRRWLRRGGNAVGSGETLQVFRRVKGRLGILRHIDLWEHQGVGTPLLTGLYRPMLVLPKIEWSEGELELVLLHELTHYVRGDLWIKSLLVWVGAVHWFNPLCALLRRDLDRWLELSCDEAVAEGLDLAGRRLYGETILNVLCRAQRLRRGPYATLCEGHRGIKRRLLHMLKDNRTSKRRAGIGAATLAILCVMGLGLSTVAFAAADVPDTDLPKVAAPKNDGFVLRAGRYVEPIVDEEEKDGIEDDGVFLVPVASGNFIMGLNGYPGHTGIDVAAPAGTPVYASRAGTVHITKESYVGYGHYIIIDHGDGYTTLYGQLKEIMVEVGAEVKAGQQIGSVGSTGNSTGNHLHFEVRLDNQPLDPESFVDLGELKND